MRRTPKLPKRATPAGIVVMIVVVAITLWQQRQNGPGAPASTAGSGPRADAESRPRTSSSDCSAVIKQAIESERSDVMVECAGVIIKELADDNDGSRHQRYLVRLDNDAVIKVSHNIDLAPRVPARQGDRIEFFGEFDWNEHGGAVHWTHHDPRGKRKGGWIRFNGTTYE